MLLNDQENVLIKGILLHLNHDISYLTIFKSIHQVPLRSDDILAIPIFCIFCRYCLILPNMLLRVFLVHLRDLQKNGSLITRTYRARLRRTRHVPKYIVRDNVLFHAKLIVGLRLTRFDLLVIGQACIAAAAISKVFIFKAPLSVFLFDALTTVKVGIAPYSL